MNQNDTKIGQQVGTDNSTRRHGVIRGRVQKFRPPASMEGLIMGSSHPIEESQNFRRISQNLRRIYCSQKQSRNMTIEQI